METKTKVIIIHPIGILEEYAPKKLVPAELLKFVNTDINLEGEKRVQKSITNHKDWKNINLLLPKNKGEFDVIHAFDNSENDGSIFLGYYNDGKVEEKPLKPIEFVRMANEKIKPCCAPNEYDNICLMKGVKINGMDLFMCWDNINENHTRGFILGHFNDGVVE